MANAQKNDETCQALIKSFGKDSETPITNKSKISEEIQTNIKIINNVIYVQRDIKKGILNYQYLVSYIPDSLMPETFKLIHSDSIAGHNGKERFLKTFVKHFYNC